MKRLNSLMILAMGTVVIALLLSGDDAATTDYPTVIPAKIQASDQSSDTDLQSGMRISVDPVTGEIIDSPSAGRTLDISPQEAARLNTSSEGLVQKPGAGGGMIVHLEDRFHSTFVATVDENGKVSIGCLPYSPDALPKSALEPPNTDTERE